MTVKCGFARGGGDVQVPLCWAWIDVVEKGPGATCPASPVTDPAVGRTLVGREGPALFNRCYTFLQNLGFQMCEHAVLGQENFSRVPEIL